MNFGILGGWFPGTNLLWILRQGKTVLGWSNGSLPQSCFLFSSLQDFCFVFLRIFFSWMCATESRHRNCKGWHQWIKRNWCFSYDIVLVWLFGLVVKILVGISISCTAISGFKSQFHSKLQLSVNMQSRRQQMTPYGVLWLSTWETWLEFSSPDFSLGSVWAIADI